MTRDEPWSQYFAPTTVEPSLAYSPDAARWQPDPDQPRRRATPPPHHPRGVERWPLPHPPLEEWTWAGIDCAIAAGFMQLNGYVRLPKGHPWRWRTYGEMPANVHGGLTFGPEEEIGTPGDRFYRPSRPASSIGGWIGFDTAHAWDYWPEEELPPLPPEAAESRRMLNELTAGSRLSLRVEWSRARLRLEVDRLAEQVAAVPLERPIDRARRRQLTKSLNTLARRRARRARRTRRPVTA